MSLKGKLLNKKILLAGGLIATAIVTLTGCGKANINVKMYEKDNEVFAQITADRDDNTVENTVNTNEKDETSREKTNESLLKDSSKEIVYSYVDDVKSWTRISNYNGRSIKESYSYKIPQINIDSEDANTINQKIRDNYGKDYEEQMEYIKKYDSVAGCDQIEYAYHINGDILSVIMASYYDGGVERNAYNINIKTGKEVTNAELLKQKGITEEEFPSKLSNVLTDVYKEMYTPTNEQISSTEITEFFNAQYKKTTAIENCSVDNEMYLNVKGDLCVIVTRYNLAGGEATKVIIDMDAQIIYAQ